MTVRRDFAALQELGVVRRTRGGIVGLRSIGETPHDARQGLEALAKQQIGALAASMTDVGDTVFLSGGTTCLALARGLAHRQGITMITNSIVALGLLVPNPDLTVIRVGGHARPLHNDMSGPPAEAALAGYRAHKGFVGTAGITEEGVFNPNRERMITDRLMITNAVQAYVLADHTKFETTSLALVCPLGPALTIVTDQPPATATRRYLEQSGVRLLVAQQWRTADSDAGARGADDHTESPQSTGLNCSGQP